MGGSASILNPEVLGLTSRACSVEQLATNGKLHAVAVKCEVTLNLMLGKTRVEQQFWVLQWPVSAC